MDIGLAAIILFWLGVSFLLCPLIALIGLFITAAKDEKKAIVPLNMETLIEKANVTLELLSASIPTVILMIAAAVAHYLSHL